MKTTKTLTGRISRMTAMTIIALSLNLTAFAGTAIEEQISVESWMTAPFELNVFEQEVAVESWMTAPFETETLENELAVESWMTAPFEVSVTA